MNQINPGIEVSWKNALSKDFESPYFAHLKEFLIGERSKYTVYPAGRNIFNAFNLTPLPAVKVVILGQDPYHGPGQAHGLCFSVPEGIPVPPSLYNIYKELKTDLNLDPPRSGNLESWARSGVLLLNATLTVRAGQAGSHQGIGWETFTDSVIQVISDLRAGVVFMLWGNYARSKVSLIDAGKHCILQAPHPSPLSASRGFLGCRHFSQANKYHTSIGLPPVDWNLNHSS
jgi:uracil-DNA glycosylase